MTAREAILHALKYAASLKTGQIAAAYGFSCEAVQAAMRRLRKEGRVVTDKQQYWRLVR